MQLNRIINSISTLGMDLLFHSSSDRDTVKLKALQGRL
jgi:hypothetical protein